MPYNETHAPEIAARDANYCYYDLPPSSVGGGYGYAFTININGQTCPSAQGTGAVGGGLLDNLRGQVGASYIENWQADTGSDSGLIATFGIPSSVTTDVSRALNPGSAATVCSPSIRLSHKRSPVKWTPPFRWPPIRLSPFHVDSAIETMCC